MDLSEKTQNADRHPWELSRAQNILKLVPIDRNFTYVDVGAGDVYFASKVAGLSGGKVFAVDSEYKTAESKEGNVTCYRDLSSVRDNSVDCLIMMDVLEHVENEDEFLKLALGKLKQDGKLILTVPAMQFLFSSHDVFLKHYRRYSRSRLLKVLRRHPLKIERSHYFYTSLFALRLLGALIEKIKPKSENVGIGSWGHKENGLVTVSIKTVLNLDFFVNRLLNRIGITLPGLSVLAICKKT